MLCADAIEIKSIVQASITAFSFLLPGERSQGYECNLKRFTLDSVQGTMIFYNFARHFYIEKQYTKWLYWNGLYRTKSFQALLRSSSVDK